MPVRIFRAVAAAFAMSAVAISVGATQVAAQQTDKLTKEPVFRTTRGDDGNSVAAANASSVTPVNMAPMDRALSIASEGLAYIRRDVRDYTAIMVKRERVNGAVTEAEWMDIKVRNAKPAEGIPLSVYMKFLKPSTVRDREVIWVDGENDGKLIAHEGTGLVRMTVRLDPHGFIAMRGNRYPITEAGIENLVYRLVEKGERFKSHGAAEVKFYENTTINGRKCTLIQVTHAEQRPEYEFHICRIFIDDELQVPVRYAAYGWPETPGGKPTLEEEYTYTEVKLNVGLTAADFDPNNSAYNFK